MAFRTNKMPILQTKSASGSVATFNTALAMPLASCNIGVDAWQEGSGDPSPSNPRAISGWSSCNIHTSDINYPSIDTSYHAYNGTTYHISLGDTYYGGSLNVTTGELTVDKLYKTYNGSENWQVSSTRSGKYRIALDEKLKNVVYPTSTSEELDCICNMFVKSNAEYTYMLTNGISYQPNYGLRIYSSSYDTSDITPWKTFLSNTPLEVVYKLATPTTVQLTPTEVRTLLGNNTIFADTGDIDLTYKDLDIAKRGNFREVFKLPS